MRVGYFVRNYIVRGSDGKLTFSGGVKVISQHVKMLNEEGIETLLLTMNVHAQQELEDLGLYHYPTVIRKIEDFPDCNLYIGSRISDVKMIFQRYKDKVVHLCQGYEPIDYISRLNEGILTEKYLKKSKFIKYLHRWKFRKRIKEIQSIYALPTIKAAVSKHLCDLIKEKYHQPCFLIPNGIDPKVFYPNPKRVWGDGRIRILSVGPINVGFKGIPDTLEAIKILKKKGVQIKFIRVSPHPPSEKEELGRVVDEYYTNLTEKEMSELYRNVDIFISSSLEGEGFGLPAMEALACGIPTILTEISSYINFDNKRDFAIFVPVRKPDRIADGILNIIENSDLRKRIQDRGLQVAQNYTLEKTKEALLSFVKELAQ